jgi:hypothetical protein
MSKTAHELSIQIVSGLNELNDSSERQRTRFQLSLKSLSILAERQVIDGVYLGNLSSELLAQGWACFQIGNTSVGFLALDSAKSFKKLSSRMLLPN